MIFCYLSWRLLIISISKSLKILLVTTMTLIIYSNYDRHVQFLTYGPSRITGAAITKLRSSVAAAVISSNVCSCQAARNNSGRGPAAAKASDNSIIYAPAALEGSSWLVSYGQ